MDIFDIEKEYFLLNLNESAGVINGYVEIGEELFNQLYNTKPKLMENGVYLRRIDNYKPITDCFIGDITLSYYTYSLDSSFIENEGGFKQNNEKEHLNKDLKLINCSFIFYEKTKNPLEINKEHFMNILSHEIGHAFRYYSIISKNNGLKASSVKKADELYGLSKNMFSNDKFNSKFFDILKKMIYLSDKDEISAFVNQTYEQMRQKTYINKSNVYNYFREFRMFRETELLKGLLVIFDNLISTKKGKDVCYAFLKNVYSDRFTGDKSIKMFRQKIATIISYRVKKFNYIIGKALVDFNRNTDNVNLENGEKKLEHYINGLNLIL